MSAHRPTPTAASLVALVPALVAVVLVVLAVTSRAGAQVIDITVPPGADEAIAAGEDLDLIPRELRVEVGDQIVVANLDDVAHEVGPYVVAPGDTVRQEFTETGVIEGVCTLHPDGAVRIVVR